MKPVEVTELPNTDPPHLAAARYLAVLAYPDDEKARDQLVKDLFAWNYKAARRHGLQGIPDEWMKVPTRDMRKRLAKAQNIIWFERFPAYLAANEIMLTEKTKGSAIRFSGEESILKVCKKYQPASQKQTHFYERAWLPSLQLLHLIGPFYTYVQSLDNAKTPLGMFVAKPQWVIKSVRSSARLRLTYLDSLLIKTEQGPLARAEQIHLTLGDPT